jgi:predicted flavoprotein YhiN
MIAYLQEHKIDVKIEENGRVMLKSGKAKHLLEFLVNKSTNNHTDHLLSREVISIAPAVSHDFVVTTSAGVYIAKCVIIAS